MRACIGGNELEKDILSTGILRNDRFPLTTADQAAAARISRSSQDQARTAVAALADDRSRDLKASLAAARREALAAAIPDLDRRSAALADRMKPQVDALKTDGARYPLQIDRGVAVTSPPPVPDGLRDLLPFPTALDRALLKHMFDDWPPRLFLDPPNAGEFWWGETHWNWTTDSLSVDGNATPWLFYGHLSYGGDPALPGNLGCSGLYFLTPDRFFARSSGHFEIRPRFRIQGTVSGWTGFYDWLWAADDKWSKCWQITTVTASLSSGETLASDSLTLPLFDLDDESPVGQANTSVFMGWEPILRFDADLRDLRQRGVSIILTMSIRYDFLLEGESDLWLWRDPGPVAPGPGNAIRVFPVPGSLVQV